MAGGKDRLAYSSLYARLVANTEIPEGQSETTGCWEWTALVKARYPRFTKRMNGKHMQIRANRAMLVLIELAGENLLFDDLYLAYTHSGLEADHVCSSATCINPDHLGWLTAVENNDKRHGKYYA